MLPRRFQDIAVVALWAAWIGGYYLIDAKGLGFGWLAAMTAVVLAVSLALEEPRIVRALRKKRISTGRDEDAAP